MAKPPHVTITITIQGNRLSVMRDTPLLGPSELLLSALADEGTAEEAARHTAQIVGHEVKRAIMPPGDGG